MSDDQDDLLSFEIAEGDFTDAAINEDELLLSDEDHDQFDDELPSAEAPVEDEAPSEPATEPEPEPAKKELSTEEPSDTGQEDVQLEKPALAPSAAPRKPQPNQNHQPSHHSMGPRPPFRQNFGPRWPNQPPRWNHNPQNQQQMPFQRGGPMRPMMQGIPPGPPRQMRPGFSQHGRPPFFNNNNNFMQSRPLIRPPQQMVRQRFFYPNQPHGDPNHGLPAYVPSPALVGGVNPVPVLPRKVHINPNFKGGVEAAKNQLLKDQYFSASSSLPEDELLRKQQEFINHNMRQIEKRRHERTPSPEYRRSYSHSPPRHRRRTNFRNNYDRKRDFGGNGEKSKDENLPEEDEETRAYRQQIETQRKRREEILRQKEMRRKEQVEKKAKETVPAEPLQPIVVTDKKIVLKRKTPEKSTTPPIKDAPVTPTRRIVLKPSKEAGDLKPMLADGGKRKIQKLLNS